MHKYLKSIGFSHIESKRMLEEILEDVEKHYDQKKTVEIEDHRIFVQYSKDYGYDCGITVCGEYDYNGNFKRDYYFPYCRGLSSVPDTRITIEKRKENQSFVGAYDEFCQGILFIYYMIDPAECVKCMNGKNVIEQEHTLVFSALADSGKVLLPIRKRKKNVASSITAKKNDPTILAAQSGDQEAAMDMALMDFSDYSEALKRMEKEDIYSIIESTFMPVGVECDQYMIMGEILDVNITRNSMTSERLYQLRVLSNDLTVEVCINERNLLGMPEPGRRFKGNIWLLGSIDPA